MDTSNFFKRVRKLEKELISIDLNFGLFKITAYNWKQHIISFLVLLAINCKNLDSDLYYEYIRVKNSTPLPAV